MHHSIVCRWHSCCCCYTLLHIFKTSTEKCFLWLGLVWLGLAVAFYALSKHDSQLDKYFSFCYYCCSHHPRCLSHAFICTHGVKPRFSMAFLTRAVSTYEMMPFQWRAQHIVLELTLWHKNHIACCAPCHVVKRSCLFIILAHLNWYILFVLYNG